MQEHLFWHFTSSGHSGFLNDVTVAFIDKLHPSDPLQIENILQETLITMVLFGLTIQNSV